MKRIIAVVAVLALAAVANVATSPPSGADELTVGNLAARHSTDGFGGQGAEPGTISVTTGADPLGVGPFQISITCSNGFTDDFELAAETTIVAFSTTAADGLDTVICEVTQADTVVYDTTAGTSGDSTICQPQVPCDSSNEQVTFQNQVPPVPGVEVRKQTNGQDAETAEDAVVLQGDGVTAPAVQWTYEVENTGDYPLLGSSLVVVDDQEGEVTCDAPVVILPGDTVSCTAIDGVADQEAYENTVTATVDTTTCQIGCIDATVTDTDTSHYRLVVPATTVPPTPTTTPPAARPAGAVRGAPAFVG